MKYFPYSIQNYIVLKKEIYVHLLTLRGWGRKLVEKKPNYFFFPQDFFPPFGGWEESLQISGKQLVPHCRNLSKNCKDSTLWYLYLQRAFPNLRWPPPSIIAGGEKHVPNWSLRKVSGGNPGKSCSMKQLGVKESDRVLMPKPSARWHNRVFLGLIQKSKSWWYHYTVNGSVCFVHIKCYRHLYTWQHNTASTFRAKKSSATNLDWVMSFTRNMSLCITNQGWNLFRSDVSLIWKWCTKINEKRKQDVPLNKYFISVSNLFCMKIFNKWLKIKHFAFQIGTDVGNDRT